MKFTQWINEKHFDTVSNYVSDVAMLQEAMIEELNAVNLYRAMAAKAGNAETKRVLLHIAEEEQHHIGELQALIKKLDPSFEVGLVDGAEEIEEIGIK